MAIERVLYFWLLFFLVYLLHERLEARAHPQRSERSESKDPPAQVVDSDMRAGAVIKVRVSHQ
jgi:hypothetical protein